MSGDAQALLEKYGITRPPSLGGAGADGGCLYVCRWEGENYRFIAPFVSIDAPRCCTKELEQNLAQEWKRAFTESERFRYLGRLADYAGRVGATGAVGPIKSEATTAAGVADDTVAWVCDTISLALNERGIPQELRELAASGFSLPYGFSPRALRPPNTRAFFKALDKDLDTLEHTEWKGRWWPLIRPVMRLALGAGPLTDEVRAKLRIVQGELFQLWAKSRQADDPDAWTEAELRRRAGEVPVADDVHMALMADHGTLDDSKAFLTAGPATAPIGEPAGLATEEKEHEIVLALQEIVAERSKHGEASLFSTQSESEDAHQKAGRARTLLRLALDGKPIDEILTRYLDEKIITQEQADLLRRIAHLLSAEEGEPFRAAKALLDAKRSSMRVETYALALEKLLAHLDDGLDTELAAQMAILKANIITKRPFEKIGPWETLDDAPLLGHLLGALDVLSDLSGEIKSLLYMIISGIAYNLTFGFFGRKSDYEQLSESIMQLVTHLPQLVWNLVSGEVSKQFRRSLDAAIRELGRAQTPREQGKALFKLLEIVGVLFAPELIAKRAALLPPKPSVMTRKRSAGVPEASPRTRRIDTLRAEKVNRPSSPDSMWEVPFLEGSKVRLVELLEDMVFVRFKTATNEITGSFLARAKEVKGMTPEQIHKHLALESVPTHVQYVDVPAGTQLYHGRIGPQMKLGHPDKGGWQFLLVERPEKQNFGQWEELHGSFRNRR